jgi:hypothetical protein
MEKMTIKTETYTEERRHGSYAPDAAKVVLKMHSEIAQTHDVGELKSYASETFLKATSAEKHEMQVLNTRLSTYIVAINQLHERNQRLIAEINDLRVKATSGRHSDISTSYSSISESRRIDVAQREKVELAVKISRLNEFLRIYGLRLDDIKKSRAAVAQHEQRLAALQSEALKLKGTYDSANAEEAALKAQNRKLWKDWKAAMAQLDEQKLNRIDLENQLKTRSDARNFLNRVYAMEKTAYHTISKAPKETRTFFEHELTTAIKSIQYEYDQILAQHRLDLEAYFKVQLMEGQWAVDRISSESSFEMTLISQMSEKIRAMRDKLPLLESSCRQFEATIAQLIAQINEEHEMYTQALNELNATLRGYREDAKESLLSLMEILLDTKQALDVEIVTYRKLVEELEKRFVIKSSTETQGEAVIRNWFEHSVRMDEDANHRWLRFENTNSTHDEDISGNVLRRSVNNQPDIVYTFPSNTIIRPNEFVTLWAGSSGGTHNPPSSLVYNAINTWGDGRTVVTTLEVNGAVRARRTKTADEQETISRQHSPAIVVNTAAFNGYGTSVHRESSYSQQASNHLLSYSAPTIVETNDVEHSSSLRRWGDSDGHSSTAIQRKEMTVGDEFNLSHEDENEDDYERRHHQQSAATTTSYKMSSSSRAHDEIPTVADLRGRFEQGGEQKVSYKFERKI